MILANADFIGGFGLWVDEDGKLNHTYSFLGVESYRQTSTKPLPAGEVSVKMLFEADEPKPGSGGNVTLWANGEQIGEGRVEKTAPMMLTSYAGMDVEPGQRSRRRPCLRGQGAVPVHGDGQEGRLRPASRSQRSTTTRWRCTSRRASMPSRTASERER